MSVLQLPQGRMPQERGSYSRSPERLPLICQSPSLKRGAVILITHS